MNSADNIALAFGTSVARTMLARCTCGADELDLVEATDLVTMRHRDWSPLGEALAAQGLGAEWSARSAELTLLASRAVLSTLAAA